MGEKESGKIRAQTGKLMQDVYYPFSVCIWMDDSGNVVDIYLFDTLHVKPQYCRPDRAKQCFLISNHPDGCMRPSDEDMRNWQKLKAIMPDSSCRLLIYSEDEGMYEVTSI